MTHWVGSISYEQRDNWDICKRESLFGSNTLTALQVRAGDELFIWASRQGWLARCRATADARRPIGTDEVPWPEPERYTALIPIEILDEPATPVPMSGDDIQQTAGIGTIQLPRFPRIDVQHAQQLTVLLSEGYRSHGHDPRERGQEQRSTESADEDPLLRNLDELRVDRQLGRPAPYQQLVLLWAVSQAVRGGDRLQPFSSVDPELRALLAPFAVGETAPDVELPWFALRRSSWWSMSPQPDRPVGRGGRDFVRLEDPVGGLTTEVYRRVQSDWRFREQAIGKLTAPLSGHTALAGVLESLFREPRSSVSDAEAADALRALVGRRLRTASGQVNEVLEVVPPNAIVATERSPQGQPVPIADVQRGLDLLRRDDAVTIDVPTLGHRSSFVGAVLAAQEGVTVAGSPPVASVLGAKRPPSRESRPVAGRFFGELPGVPVGTVWASRAEVSQAGIHRPTQSGISGTRAEGCDSIVVSGGYEDDWDDGDEILYTGAGGNDPATGRQIADQTLEQSGNAGLVTSQHQGLPVRVVRGAKGDPAHSPRAGYRYDGLYRVAEHWSKVGKSGFRIWQFHLVRLSDQEAAPYVPEQNVPAGRQRPRTSQGVTTRVVRDTRVSRFVKQLYRDACQVCGTRLEVPGGAISEGAHIRALGRPHHGPDTVENILCLCPNHHTLFDEGGIYVSDDLQVHDHNGVVVGTLEKHGKHSIDLAHLKSHRERWGF